MKNKNLIIGLVVLVVLVLAGVYFAGGGAELFQGNIGQRNVEREKTAETNEKTVERKPEVDREKSEEVVPEKEAIPSTVGESQEAQEPTPEVVQSPDEDLITEFGFGPAKYSIGEYDIADYSNLSSTPFKAAHGSNLFSTYEFKLVNEVYACHDNDQGNYSVEDFESLSTVALNKTGAVAGSALNWVPTSSEQETILQLGEKTLFLKLENAEAVDVDCIVLNIFE